MKDDLAKDILESAAPSSASRSWFDALSPEHQSAVREVRDNWRRTREASGVSASQMAKTIHAKLVERGYKVSRWRQIQRWLTQG